MSGTGGPAPIRVGDEVQVSGGGAVWPARVVATGKWSYIVALDASGHLWMEVVMSLSAASWTCVVELSDAVDPADGAGLDDLAAAIAWRPRRTDVADVARVRRLLQPGADIRRTATVTSVARAPK